VARVTYAPDVALVVVDLQNDFGHPRGNLYVAGGEDLVEDVNAEVAAARDAGALVVWTQDWHPPSTPHFDTDGGVWPVHCVGDTWGAELLPGLDVHDDDPVVRKGTDGGDGYSAFSVRDPASGDEQATRLGALLAERGVQRVVVVGLAQDVCVRDTVLDARRLGYGATLLAALTRPVDPSAVDAVTRSLVAAGATVS
jgi:nicotinamidase/pyrazinamidase